MICSVGRRRTRFYRLSRIGLWWLSASPGRREEDAMDCCGHAHAGVRHPWMGSTPLASVGAMLAGAAGPRGSTEAARTADTTAAALVVLRDSISVDVHSHGGNTGIISKAPPSNDLADAMRAGSLAAACLADVPDWPVLGRTAEGALAAIRAPESGELYRYHVDRLAWMDELVTRHGARRALCAADLEAAHKAGHPAIIADVEGLDFLEMKLERLEAAHRRGIRHVQLVHYTPNDLGYFQTGGVTASRRYSDGAGRAAASQSYDSRQPSKRMGSGAVHRPRTYPGMARDC